MRQIEVKKGPADTGAKRKGLEGGGTNEVYNRDKNAQKNVQWLANSRGQRGEKCARCVAGLGSVTLHADNVHEAREHVH